MCEPTLVEERAAAFTALNENVRQLDYVATRTLPATAEECIQIASDEGWQVMGIATAALRPLFTAARQRLSHGEAAEAAAALLLVSPFSYTAWNRRRERLLAALQAAGCPSSCFSQPRDSGGAQAPIAVTPLQLAATHSLLLSELHLVSLIQSRHPKPAEAWCFRRWLIDGLSATALACSGEDEDAAMTTAMASAVTLLQQELQYSGECASIPTPRGAVPLHLGRQHPRNYSAWTHRWCVLQRLAALHLHAQQQQQQQQQLVHTAVRELAHTEPAVRLNPADTSAWHYRLSVLQLLLRTCEAPAPVAALCDREMRLLAHIAAVHGLVYNDGGSRDRITDNGTGAVSLKYHAAGVAALQAKASTAAAIAARSSDDSWRCLLDDSWQER